MLRREGQEKGDNVTGQNKVLQLVLIDVDGPFLLHKCTGLNERLVGKTVSDKSVARSFCPFLSSALVMSLMVYIYD